MPIKVEIVTPERLLMSRDADMVTLPGESGQMGVMGGHAPLMTTLVTGEIILHANDDEQEALFVNGGIAEVRPDVVTILADVAERVDDIDIQRAEAARARAEASVAEAGGVASAPPVHVAALRRSQVRLRIARRRRPQPGSPQTN
ncbi:MAG: ATP synthase F1 subunit epsilon [Caldilineaceae bacterium SB0662_bin_9]|uniref:ATP synthase epsilon chain n=1 Tax=Caldilineaceae bacterium SB0662_bin_9 TaxID=2605258 RepID=A0A6B1DU99_9CHLR|nr:ATP synthase F1 subunit epsilon [Caldilineaceae bacterium SB0662_bin_9]